MDKWECSPVSTERRGKRLTFEFEVRVAASARPGAQYVGATVTAVRPVCCPEAGKGREMDDLPEGEARVFAFATHLNLRFQWHCPFCGAREDSHRDVGVSPLASAIAL